MEFYNIVEPQINKYLFAKAQQKEIPLSGTFELSPCCNMDCKMCYVRKSRTEVESAGGEIPAERWIELGRQCRDAGTLFMLITGGEPFLYKGFREVYEALQNMGMQLEINTNATMITDDDAAWLAEHGPDRVNVTLYGASNDTYARLCGAADGFDRTISAVRRLKDAGIRVRLKCSLTPYNVGDVKEIYKIADELNIHLQCAEYMFPPIRRYETAFGQGERFSAYEAAKCRAKLALLDMSAADLDEVKRKYFKDIEAGLNDAAAVDNGCAECEGEPLRCRAGRATYWINWRGIMTPCGMMNSPEAYPFRDGFKNAWKQIVQSTKQIRLPAKCASCKHKNNCGVCGAKVFNESGSFDVCPQYICDEAKYLDEIFSMDTEQLYKLVMDGRD